MDAPPGLEPELFGIKIRRVANYTKGHQTWWESEVSILPRERTRFTVLLPEPPALPSLIPYTLSVNPILDCGKESDIRQRSPSVSLA
jgi:hypothetical protein